MKKLKYSFILIGIVFIIDVGISFINNGPAKHTLNENSIKALEAIRNLRPVSYSESVSNHELEKYYKLRDKYNIKLYKEYEKIPNSYGSGLSYRGSYFFFNWCIIRFIEDSDIKSYDFMNSSGNVHEVEHIVLLTKKNGNWYVVKDIFTPGQSANYLNLINFNYTTKKIQELRKAYLNL